jgi:hypothetical protein
VFAPQLDSIMWHFFSVSPFPLPICSKINMVRPSDVPYSSWSSRRTDKSLSRQCRLPDRPSPLATLPLPSHRLLALLLHRHTSPQTTLEERSPRHRKHPPPTPKSPTSHGSLRRRLRVSSAPSSPISRRWSQRRLRRPSCASSVSSKGNPSLENHPATLPPSTTSNLSLSPSIAPSLHRSCIQDLHITSMRRRGGCSRMSS